MSSNNNCKPNFKNSTNYLDWKASNEFEGIPENLVINSCGFIFIVVCFFILRKSAFKSESAESKRSNRKLTKGWTSLFFTVNNQTDPKKFDATTFGKF